MVGVDTCNFKTLCRLRVALHWVTSLCNLAIFKRNQLGKQKTLFFGEHGVEGVCGRPEVSSGLQGQGTN